MFYIYRFYIALILFRIFVLLQLIFYAFILSGPSKVRVKDKECWVTHSIWHAVHQNMYKVCPVS